MAQYYDKYGKPITDFSLVGDEETFQIQDAVGMGGGPITKMLIGSKGSVRDLPYSTIDSGFISPEEMPNRSSYMPSSMYPKTFSSADNVEEMPVSGVYALPKRPEGQEQRVDELMRTQTGGEFQKKLYDWVRTR